MAKARVPVTLLLALLAVPVLRGAPGSRPPVEGPVVPPPGLSRGVHLLVEKAARRLVLYRDRREERRFPVGLGFAPVGTKDKQGDGKTPEGEYRVCRKNPASRFHLSLGLDYPNAADAERAFAAGVISKAQRNGIRASARGRGCPPWSTPLGGEIFIHGSGSSSDWTLGCVALDDPDMDVLYGACPVGTPVTIRP